MSASFRYTAAVSIYGNQTFEVTMTLKGVRTKQTTVKTG